jgi:hypothetical protein
MVALWRLNCIQHTIQEETSTLTRCLQRTHVCFDLSKLSVHRQNASQHARFMCLSVAALGSWRWWKAKSGAGAIEYSMRAHDRIDYSIYLSTPAPDCLSLILTLYVHATELARSVQQQQTIVGCAPNIISQLNYCLIIPKSRQNARTHARACRRRVDRSPASRRRSSKTSAKFSAVHFAVCTCSRMMDDCWTSQISTTEH